MKKLKGRMYEFGAGIYCGVFVPEKVMKRLAKLNAKYNDEVKKILVNHKDTIYPTHCTGHYEDEGSNTIYFVLTTDAQNEIQGRINLFKAPLPKYHKDIYIVDSYEAAGELAKQLYFDNKGGKDGQHNQS